MRWSTLKTYKPINRVGKKRKESQPLRDECVATVLARANSRCEAKIEGVCRHWKAAHVHEYHTRGQCGSPLDPDNCFAVCALCHNHIHTHPKWASESNLMRSKKWEAQRGQ